MNQSSVSNNGSGCGRGSVCGGGSGSSDECNAGSNAKGNTVLNCPTDSPDGYRTNNSGGGSVHHRALNNNSAAENNNNKANWINTIGNTNNKPSPAGTVGIFTIAVCLPKI